MGSTPEGPTRKREATQTAILDAAVALVVEKGIDGFTLSAVAQRGKINRALIYHYFHDRENLVFQAIRHIVQRYEETKPPGGPDAAERSARMHIDHPEIGRFFFQLLLTNRPMPPLSRRMVAAIEALNKLKAANAPDSPYDPEMSVMTGWLAQLSWSFARTEIARLLGMTVEEADRRFIASMRLAGKHNMEQIGGPIS
ncbi:MAG: TetR/AcrR family transcriptional regulator [Dehalococcoidia bacterium]